MVIKESIEKLRNHLDWNEIFIILEYVLDKSKLEPAFVVGGIVPEINTNAQHKSGKFFTAELY